MKTRKEEERKEKANMLRQSKEIPAESRGSLHFFLVLSSVPRVQYSYCHGDLVATEGNLVMPTYPLLKAGPVIGK